MASVPPQFDFDQVLTERRATLELILIVLFLGLLLNGVVSAAFLLVEKPSATAVLVVLIILSVTVLALLIPLWVLKRAGLVTDIPVVLFFDNKAQTISLPSQIHYPQPNRSGPRDASMVSIPFPILARLYFDRYKNQGQLDQSILSDILKGDDDILTQLIQFVILHHYICAHQPTWGPAHGFGLGPFLHVGSARSLPSTEYGADELRARSENSFLQFLGANLPMSLPEGTDVQFFANTFQLYGRLFQCKLATHLRSAISMQMWPHALGTLSSWHRSLSSDYSDTHALLFTLRIDFSLKVRIWRFISEDRVPERFRPQIALRDIADWINRWVSSLQWFLEWVDEDLSFLPRAEIASLVDESGLVYEPQLEGASRIHFKPYPGGTPAAGSMCEDSGVPATCGTGSGEETANMGQRQTIESHGGNVDLEHDFSAAVQWLRSRGQVELRTSKPTRFTAEAAVTKRGVHQGDSVIIFRQRGREYGRAYACCWGHYYNCNRTRIGMYCTALDAAM